MEGVIFAFRGVANACTFFSKQLNTNFITNQQYK